MAPEPNTPSVASLKAQDAELNLTLGDYNVNAAAVGCSGDGIKFAFTIWPLSDATVAALESLAVKHGRICLYCCGKPVLLDLVSLERKEPRRARIAGRVVGDISGSTANSRKVSVG